MNKEEKRDEKPVSAKLQHTVKAELVKESIQTNRSQSFIINEALKRRYSK